VFRDYLELTEYDPRYVIVPYMPRLDAHGLSDLFYPSRPMFPRFYMGETILWDHMEDRDETFVPPLCHIMLMSLVCMQINPSSYFHLGILILEPCEIQYHLYRYTYLPYIEEDGFELYHEIRNKFCVIHVTNLHENNSENYCGYLALLSSEEPINMLYTRFETYGTDIYIMASSGNEDDDVVEIFQPPLTKPREIINLTLDDADSKAPSNDFIPTQQSYDTDSYEEDSRYVPNHHIAEAKAFDGKYWMSTQI
jgi:hypothetical protein